MGKFFAGDLGLHLRYAGAGAAVPFEIAANSWESGTCCSYFTGTLLHRESILFEFERQFPVINPKFIYEHISDDGLIQQSSRNNGSIAGHPPAFRAPRLESPESFESFSLLTNLSMVDLSR